MREALGARPAREWLAVLAPWVLVAAGVALAVAAALPEVVLVAATTLMGEVEPQTSDTYAFPYEGYTFATFAFREEPSCALLLFVLNEEQATRFEETGDLPDLEEALHCDALQGTFERPVALIVFDNRFDQPFTYDVAVEVFSVRQPRALLALPALVLFLVGIFPLLTRLLRRETKLLVEEHVRRLQEQREQEEIEKR